MDQLLIPIRIDVFRETSTATSRVQIQTYIRVEHAGNWRKRYTSVPRVHVGHGHIWLPVSLEAEPKVLDDVYLLSKDDMRILENAMAYIRRNHDVLLKYYNDMSGNEFTRDELIKELRSRGDYIEEADVVNA